MLFAVPSFYWALGGDFAEGTIAADVDEALGSAAEPWVVAVTGVTKLLFAAFALSFVWLAPDPYRRARTTAGVVLGAGLALYGMANFAGHLVMLTGVDDVPEALGRTAVYWHTFLWDPYWVLGGVLFLMAVRRFARTSTP